MIISKTSINRPVFTTMLVVALMILGGIAYLKLPLNVMPETNIPIITVQVVYPGASPEEIESNITQKIEDEISTIGGIDYFESYVLPNASLTIIRFKMKQDIDVANQEVKDKIDAILSKFPDDAENPVISKIDINAKPIMELSFVSSMNANEAFQYVDNHIKDKLSKIGGVSKVEISGGSKRVIDITLSKNNLEKFSLTPLAVIGQIKSNNLSLPSGTMDEKGNEFSLNVDGEFQDLEDIKNLRIITPLGVQKLGNIAKINDTYEKLKRRAYFYDKNKKNSKETSVINISIKKQSDANSVETAKKISKQIDKLNSQENNFYTLEVTQERAKFIEDSVNDTMNTIYMGIILTAIILYFFLHSIRITIIVAVSMPAVLISTFMLANFSGFSLNMMSLMALSVSVGTLVTNSVIILENIIRYVDMGSNPIEASDKGTAEIAVAVLASTLTNVVVFVPIASMESIVGQFFVEFGMMVTYAMIFSVIISLTLTPMLSSKLLVSKKKKKRVGFLGRMFDKFLIKVTDIYSNTLKFIIKYRWSRIVVIIGVIVAMILSVVIVIPNMGAEFVPFVDDGKIKIEIEYPTYYTLKKTEKEFKNIETILSEFEEIKIISTNIGKLSINKAPYLGEINITMIDDPKISTHELTSLIAKKLYLIPDAKIQVIPISSMKADNGESPITIEVTGEDMTILENLTLQVEKIVKSIDGTGAVKTNIKAGKPEIKMIPNRQKLSEYQTSVSNIAMTMRAFFEGLKASVYKEKAEEYDIVVRLDKEDFSQIEDIKNMPIMTQKGNVKLSELCDIKYEKSPTMINRKNRIRKYKVSGEPVGRSVGNIIKEAMTRIKNEINIPKGYNIKAGGDAEMMADANKDFGQAFILAIVLTFMLIAAILESYKQAVLIMGTIPLAFIGVLWAIFITGESMNIFSMMAGVMLIGIVVNNAILILDYANQLRKSGESIQDSIIKATHTKLRAILMATLSTITGMIPLALGLGSGAALRQGMGIVTIGGLLVSAILTLYLIPVLYVQFEKKYSVKTDEESISK